MYSSIASTSFHDRRLADLDCRRLPAPSAREPITSGVSSPGNSYVDRRSRTSISTSSRSSSSSTMSALFRYTTMYGTPTWRAQQNVLARLRHRAVRRRHHQNRSVHLRRARDHVLHVVRVTRAVNVRVVTVLALVLNVRRRNRDATLTLFRRVVNLVERLRLAPRTSSTAPSSAPPSASSCRGQRGRSCPRSRAACCVQTSLSTQLHPPSRSRTETQSAQLVTCVAGTRPAPPDGGGGRIRTYVGISQQIYSLPSLTA
jgi:hypothetical protein